MTPAPSDREIEHLLREAAPQVLGALTRRHGDFAMAEDAVQDALLAAAAQWPEQGLPKNPRGWLYHVAMRRVTDLVRSELSRRRREDAVAAEVVAEWAFVPPPDAELGAESDDSLVLLMMCCHPALTQASAIALTLRAVGGLTTAEIARAFMVPEATVAQRISRAKQTIKQSQVGFHMPESAERDERMRAVQHVLYLVFNEGYVSTSGAALSRVDLSDEAIRLARMLRGLLPADPETAGLLALMLLTDARRAARSGAAGELIPLDEQDRTKWDRGMIDEGIALVTEALQGGAPGPYQIQAAIAALHDEVERVEDTDWEQILALYDVLDALADNPAVALSRAVAVAMVHGPDAALELLDELEADGRLTGQHRLDAVRGHLLERAGEIELAIAHFHAAAEKTASTPERDYLLLKAAKLALSPRTPPRRAPAPRT